MDGRKKNALREHYIAPYTETTPTETTYLRLAKWITSISDSSDEEVDDVGYYDGDGTAETEVMAIKGAYDFEGTFDPTDPAQKLIAGMKYKIGQDRKCWHKIVSADGTETLEGVATVTDIVAGSGEATENEEFSCTITYNQIPTVSGGGGSAPMALSGLTIDTKTGKK